MDRKMVLFFFSGTGNTWWCAKTFERAAAEHNLQVECVSLEALTKPATEKLLAAADLMGLAYPIYGSDAPEPVHKFVNSLADLETRTTAKALVFCTQYLWSGDGAAVGAALLESVGFHVPWTQHILMPNNVCLPIHPKLPFTNDKQRLANTLKRATKKLERLALRVSQDRPLRHGRSFWARQLGCIQRVPYRRMQPKLRTLLAIDDTACTGCGLCVELCPTANIHNNASDQLIMGDHCALCLRCYNFCPVSAVTAVGRHHETRRGIPYRGPSSDFDPRLLRCSAGEQGARPTREQTLS